MAMIAHVLSTSEMSHAALAKAASPANVGAAAGTAPTSAGRNASTKSPNQKFRLDPVVSMYKYCSHGYIMTHWLYCWPYRRARRCSRMLRILFHPLLTLPRHCLLLAAAAAIAAAAAGSAAADGIALTKAPPLRVPSAYDWSGTYAGGHVGQAWGTSNWTSTPGIPGSTSLYQPFNGFDGTGSVFAGFQAG